MLSTASDFSDEKTLYIIKVPAGCYNCLSIKDLSVYSSEDEYLIPPYSVFKLKERLLDAKVPIKYLPESASVIKERKYVEIVILELAQDNKKHKLCDY